MNYWLIVCGLVPFVLSAQSSQRTRAVDSVTTRDGRIVVAATNDSSVLITIRSRERTVDAVPSVADVSSFLDSASVVLWSAPKREPREEVLYSVRAGGMLLTRFISDRGESVRLEGADADRFVEVSLNPPQAARLLEVLRMAVRTTSKMTGTDAVALVGRTEARAGVPASPAARQPTYFDYQTDEPAAPLAGNDDPLYPRTLRADEIEGNVVAQFVVDADGRADLATFRVLRSPHVLLSSAVKSALSSWRFSPAQLRGSSVRQLMQLTFRFRDEQ